jgi:flagellar biosynthesis/type III secretory pathway chaperone
MQNTILLNKFLGLLEQVAELYQSLLDVMGKERNAVINTDLCMLNEAAKVKDNLLLKLRILEEQRVHLLGELADHLQQSREELTLTKLSQLVEKPHAIRLKGCRSRLLTAIKKVQEANEHNRSLFSHSLELIKGSVNLLNNLMTSSPVYFRTGNIQRRDYTGKILQGEI